MPKKICNYKGCKAFIAYNQAYCEEHQKQKEQDIKERHKHYDRHRTDEKEQQFYNSREWKLMTKIVRGRDLNMCLSCGIEEGVFADAVHHIEELKENWSRRLAEDNLISLCDSCHKITHAEYKKGKFNKQKEQKRLRKLIRDARVGRG